MHRIAPRSRIGRGRLLVGLAVLGVGVQVVASPVRDLPDTVVPGVTISVSIALNVPPGTVAAGAEDAPPAGWTVGVISNGGSFDGATGKVKWGPFFDPSIPATLTYDVTPSSGSSCFAGTVSFDLASETIGGEPCAVVVPTVGAWGLLTLTLGLLAGASAIIRQRRG